MKYLLQNLLVCLNFISRRWLKARADSEEKILRFDGGPILVFAAHPDDEVLGCGGTIALLAEIDIEVHVVFFTDGVSARGEKDSVLHSAVSLRFDEAQRAKEILGYASLTSLNFPDNRLDHVPILEIAREVQKVTAAVGARTVFTHDPFDLNVDHRRVTEAVEIASRPTTESAPQDVIFYETLSSTEWKFQTKENIFCPSVYVDISNQFPKKIAALEAYHSEMRQAPHSRSIHGATVQAAWRGLEIGSVAAEGFVVGRQRLGVGDVLVK